MSWKTSTWPSHSMPAPIPMVIAFTFWEMIFASCRGIDSRTIANAPASSTAIASSISFFAASRDLPCTLKPPSIPAV